MSVVAADRPLQRGPERARERRMGELGMWLFIATEATLFSLLFFAYIYLGLSQAHWPLEDPRYGKALMLAGILIASSVTAYWGQRAVEHGRMWSFKLALGLTLALGVAFIGLQIFEYRGHLQTLHPRDNSYGSIFYTIVSFHFLHVAVGWLMLWYVFARAWAGHFSSERHLAVKNVITYWHFVDFIWLFVVAILYISPQLYGPRLP